MTISRMHHPLHLGEVLREYMKEKNVPAVARHLRVARVILSRIVTGTQPSFRYDMQPSHDMWQATQASVPALHA